MKRSSRSKPYIDFEAISLRMGPERAAARILAQADLWARLVHQGEGLFVIERYLPVDTILCFLLKAIGLYGRGRRNFLDPEVVLNRVHLARLPRSFEGFKILQLSDLHCDLDPGLVPILLGRLEALQYDVAVITGDFRNSTREDYARSMTEVIPIVDALKKPAFGVLGNHDAVEMVPFLEELGLTVLLNESAEVVREDDSLFLIGIDDPHFYKTHDFSRALSRVPEYALKILLSHSPETYLEAQRLGFSLLLAGHTHGGQICLPGGIPVIRNGRCPVHMIAGRWLYNGLRGYTSRGTGSCGVAVRFNCPPELTIHVLHNAEDALDLASNSASQSR